ncbi:MAG: hypothetical protein ACLTFB_01280 [Candidatus Phytoplasma pyri]
MVKNFDLQKFLIKNKKIFIIVTSILFLIILGILLYQIYNNNYFSTNKPISSESNQEKDESNNSESNQEDESNKLIHKIDVKEGEELKQIKEYLQEHIFTKYSHLKSKKGMPCELFDFSFFIPHTYNSIDKTITAKFVGSEGQTYYIVQPGSFNCPIKDAPDDLIAVYFDGGLKRGGDEEEDEEGNEIPRYTLEDLKKMHNGGTIYIFYKK